MSTTSSGILAHDELKERFGYDRGIVRRFTVFTGRPLEPDDPATVTEEVRQVGEERRSAVGTGRDWCIDVLTHSADGALRLVERWDMFGYRSGSATTAAPTSSAGAPAGASGGASADAARTTVAPSSAGPSTARELASFLLTAEQVRDRARANEAGGAVHHDTEAAQAAGARDIFLDTRSQISLFSDLLATAIPCTAEDRLVAVALTMRAPICAGDRVGIMVDDTQDSTDDAGRSWTIVSMSAHVGARTHSRAELRLLRRTEDGPDPAAVDLGALLT
ncbi:MAG: hypothetical protein KGR18_05000 [Acidobacteria bacterium]|nr:hypothetical protein [Acidobacteriota bacterium]